MIAIAFALLGFVVVVTDAATHATTLAPAPGARRANTAADVAVIAVAPVSIVPGARRANTAADVAELREAPVQLVPPASTRQQNRPRPVSHASARVRQANIALVAAQLRARDNVQTAFQAHTRTQVGPTHALDATQEQTRHRWLPLPTSCARIVA